MAADITYLLGAGASTGALPNVSKIPVVANFSEALFKLHLDMEESHFIRTELLQEEVHKKRVSEIRTELSHYIVELKDELIDFSSIDTYARFLFYTNPTELRKFKALLDFCFTYWQIKNGIDPRYDSLISLLLNGPREQPHIQPNVKIITWNYDIQLESCLARYFGVTNLKEPSEKIGFYPTEGSMSNSDKFSIYKLNGSAQTYLDNDGNILRGHFSFHPRGSKPDMQILKKDLLKSFEEKLSNPALDYFLSYSWEGNEVCNAILELAKQAISQTEILVIIGYSFPLINKTVDYDLLNAIDPNRLKQIYVQVLPGESNGVIERCRLMMQEKFESAQGSTFYYDSENHRHAFFKAVDYINPFFAPFELR